MREGEGDGGGEGEGDRSGGGRRRLLQEQPPPLSPAAAASPPPASANAGNGTGNASASAFAQWSTGPVGLNTNDPPPVTEFITVDRINKTHFRLLAPNGKYLLAPETSNQLLPFGDNKTDAAMFTATRLGTKQIVLQTSDGRYVGWGSGAGVGPLALLPNTSFQEVYGGNYPPTDYYTFYVREVMQVARMRGVNLGGWLMAEQWMTPNLYDGVPDLVDGWQLQLESVTNSLWLSAGNPSQVTCNIGSNVVGDMETWALRRVGDYGSGQVQLRLWKAGRYLSVPVNGGGAVTAASDVPASDGSDVLVLEESSDGRMIALKATSNGMYLAVQGDGRVLANAASNNWEGNTAFLINRLKSVQSEYQISKYATNAASQLKQHRETFIQEGDWSYLASKGINTVRIPIGWWIAQGEEPDEPYIAGGDAILDNAFVMAEKYNIRIFLSMHAAPGGQNHGAECSSRDGVVDWGRNPAYRQKTLATIDWLANRYAGSPAFFGIGLLNEPNVDGVTPGVLMEYLEQGYAVVRNYSASAFVGITPILGHSNDWLADFMTDPIRHNNVVVDVHYYNVFDPVINTNTNLQAQFDYTARLRNEMDHYTRGDRTVIVGEWSLALPEGVGASQNDYGTFSRVQLLSFNNASAGWFFWSYKVTAGSTGFPNWSFLDAPARGWLQYQ